MSTNLQKTKIKSYARMAKKTLENKVLIQFHSRIIGDLTVDNSGESSLEFKVGERTHPGHTDSKTTTQNLFVQEIAQSICPEVLKKRDLLPWLQGGQDLSLSYPVGCLSPE